MGVFGELTGLGKAFWDLAFNRGRGNTINSKLLKDVTGSEILDGGQKVIEGMRLTTGTGEPENGELFGQGWSRFKDAGETLTSAFPNESWTGEGADAYIGQNRTQTGRTNTVALLDRGVQTVIAREAYQVAYHRDKLDDQSNFLADLSYVTMALGLVPGYGKAMKATVEAAAVQAALSICSLELYELSREANQNAAELHQAVGLYAGAATTAPPTQTPTLSTPPPPPPGGGSPPRGPANGGRVAPTPTPAPAMVPEPTPNVAASSSPPAAPQLPATPATPADGLAQLGAALAPLGALLAGAAQPAAQTPPAAPAAAPAAAPKKSTKKKDDDEEDEDKASPGHDEGEAERAPVHTEADADPARLHAPMPVTLDADRPPTPPATTPQA